MSEAINSTTNNFGTPYLTLAEYKNAPTNIDIDNLVYNSIDPLAQDTELSNVIARASSWIDTYCNQILGATKETETQRNRIRNDGTIRFHPRYNPIVALTALAFGTNPDFLTQVPDCSVCWLENQQVIFPFGTQSYNQSGTGPVVFGSSNYSGAEVFLKYTYINGYANTLIAVAEQLATSLTVVDGTGITAGQTLKIYSGMNAETVTVANTYVFGSETVPLTKPLLYTHTAGTSISALPPAIKEAAILVTTSFLKVRGDNSMVMSVGSTPGQAVEGAQNIGTELALAQELLKPYRRIR